MINIIIPKLVILYGKKKLFRETKHTSIISTVSFMTFVSENILLLKKIKKTKKNTKDSI